MADTYCEHIQRGEARIYQRLEIAGRDLYQCWTCAGNVNPILSKVEDLWERFNRIANKQPDQRDGEPNTSLPLWATTREIPKT